MSENALIDAETMVALRVLRGDHKKNPNAIDRDFGSCLANQIVDALSSQKEALAVQTSELIDAVREQTSVLQKLTALIENQQQKIGIVNKQEKESSSVTSTSAITEPSTVVDEPAVDNPLDTMEQATVPKSAPEPTPDTTTVAASSFSPIISRGQWGFVESDDAVARRSLIEKEESASKNLNSEDALFGKVSRSDLIGDSFGDRWIRMRQSVDQYGKVKPPKWSDEAKGSVRAYLPRLTIGGKTEIKLDSGIYYLAMKYENNCKTPIEAAVVIGEISFENNGCILASGAKWKKILNGETQREPRVTSSKKAKWYSSPVSESWENGDILRFKIDTYTNTLVYTLSAAGATKAKAGWKFQNIFAFTSIPTYPDEVRIFGYCGGKGKSSHLAKLSLVEETSDTISDVTNEESTTATMEDTESEANEE